MPRIYTGNNDPIDWCKHCFPKQINAIIKYGPGEGPDGRGNCYDYEAAHPPYAGNGYRCDNCRKILGDKDE